MTTQPNSSVSYKSSPLSIRHLEGAMMRVLCVAVTLIVGMPGVALAQATASTSPPAPISIPIPADWQRVKPGREVWVTTNTGSLVHGEITAISDRSLSIREQDREVTLRLADVRLVEGRDSKKNGFLIGAIPGALAGGLMGGVLAAGCEYECDGTAGAIGLLVAGGAAGGGLIGMIVDGLIPGRQTLFRGSAVVTPVITPTKKAINVAIRLR